MRFVTYLASAALVARADVMEEDDDLSFMRMLSGHNASNTTVATTSPATTAASDNVTNTTAAATSSDTNTTAAATTSDSNTTAAATSSDSNTTAAATSSETTETTAAAKASDSNTTAAASSSTETTAAATQTEAASETVTTAAAASNANAVSETAQAAQSAKAANVTEGTDMEATTAVEIVVSYSAADPLGDAIANDGVVATTTAAPAESSTNSTMDHGHRRRLDVATLVKAHNLFCGAFAFTASASVCEALGDTALMEFFGGADADAAKNNCYTGVTADAQSTATGYDDDCSSTTAGSLGVCYESSTVAANAAMSGTTMFYGETKACTLAVTASGSSTFTTSTMMELPTWLATASEDTFTVDVAAIESTATTNAGSSEAAAVLTNALVIAAVAIATDPDTSAVMDPDAGLGVNLTETLGIPEDTFTSIVSAVEAGGGVAALPLADLAAEPDASEGGLAALMSTAVAAVESTYAPTAVATTATTSSMASMVTVSAALGLLSLVF